MKDNQENITRDWKLYEAGIAYNNAKDVIKTAKINTDFYEGNQWIGAKDTSLPKPTFNVLKRVGSYFIASLTSNPIKAFMSPLMFENFDRSKVLEYNIPQATEMVNAIDIADATLNKILERNKFQDKVRDALTRGCKTGDMCFHIRFDTSIKPYVYLPQALYKGDVVIDVIDGVNVYFGDVNTPNVEKQPYIIINGRDTIEHLKEEMKSKNKDNIYADNDTEYFLKQEDELDADEDETNKCTYIIKYFKKKVKNPMTGEEEYKVFANKCTRTAIIYENLDTGLTRYPIAFGNWERQAGTYHGRALVTGLIPNQIFINRMWAMMMYHLSLNAFPKPIYNASRISNWTNEVGQAIPVQDNGEPNFDINNMAKFLEPSSISTQVVEAIRLCMEQTKDMLGISDATLGNVNPTNTSAIVAVQKSSAVPLKNQQANLYEFVEDTVLIILDMIANKYGIRDVCVDMKTLELGNVITLYDFGKLKDLALSLNIDIGQGNYYDEIAQLQTVDNLLMQGQISLRQYLERIPDSVLPKRIELLKEVEQQEAMMNMGLPGAMPPTVPEVTGSQGGRISQGYTADQLIKNMQSQDQGEQIDTLNKLDQVR